MSDLPPPIKEFMQEDLELVSETTSAVDAAVRMAEKRIGCLVVQGKGEDPAQQPIIGLVSETDLVRKVMGNCAIVTPHFSIKASKLLWAFTF